MTARIWKQAAKKWRARALELEAELEGAALLYDRSFSQAYQRAARLQNELSEERRRAQQAEHRHYEAEERVRRLQEERRRARW